MRNDEGEFKSMREGGETEQARGEICGARQGRCARCARSKADAGGSPVPAHFGQLAAKLDCSGQGPE
jgi:hypothetical protein